MRRNGAHKSIPEEQNDEKIIRDFKAAFFMASLAVIICAIAVVGLSDNDNINDIDTSDPDQEEYMVGGGTDTANFYGPDVNGTNGTYRLAYNKIGSTNNVTLVGWDSSPGYSVPSGTLALESTVTWNEVTYTVTAIGEGAFKDCTELTGNLIIPDSVASIGNNVFDRCSGFNGTLTLPTNVGFTNISYNAFRGCSGLTGSLTIPDSVRVIGQYAFDECKGFNGALTLPMNGELSAIGAMAFRGCSGLTGSLTIPDSVNSIGQYAFTECKGFNGTLTLPINENFKTIEMYTFRRCTGLRGLLTIPESVVSIGSNAFLDCLNFTGNLILPSNLTRISEYAFKGCSNLTGSLTIPDSVTSIGSVAFGDCKGFNGTLTLPTNASFKTIGSFAFRGCSGLTGSLTIPDTVTSIEEMAFWNCSGFNGTLTLPTNASFKAISNSAFNGCSNLTGNLTIPNTVTSIGNSAFNGCSNLTGNLTIPNTVTSIGNSAFDGCSNLTGNLTIPSGVTSIEAFTFNGCSKLTGNLTIPNTVTSIGTYAFAGCKGFNGTLTLPTNASFKAISNAVFNGCSNLTGNLTIPDSVTSIDNSAFSGCSNLTGNLTIPDSVTSIGNSAFRGCSNLTGNLTIPDSVTSIGTYTFNGCSNLTGNLTIPDSVTSIGTYAFKGCSNLTGNLTIPDSVTSIGNYAFEECRGLNGILTLPTNANFKIIGTGAFKNTSFTGSLKIPDSVTDINGESFRYCDSLTAIEIDVSVNTIGSFAFNGCTNLKEIYIVGTTLPETVSANSFDEAVVAFYSHGDKSASWWDGKSFTFPTVKRGVYYDMTLTAASEVNPIVLSSVHVPSSRDGVDLPITMEWIESKTMPVANKVPQFSVDGGITWQDLEGYVIKNDITGVGKWGGGYIINVSTGVNGTAFADNTEPDEGDDVVITMTPIAKYKVLSIIDNGIAVSPGDIVKDGNSWKYTIRSVSVDHDIVVAFGIDDEISYNIELGFGSGGTATSPTSANGGSNVTVVITPNSGFRIKSVKDNGSVVAENKLIQSGNSFNYVIETILEAHNVNVQFEIDPMKTHTVTVNKTGNGTAQANYPSAAGGSNVKVTITPAPGYKIASVTDDDADVEDSLEAFEGFWTYTIYEIYASHTIDVEFEIDTNIVYNVTKNVSGNGSVTISDERPNGGSNVTVTLSPDPGYKIKSLKDNGTTVQTSSLTPSGNSFEYTISSILANHTITVEFEIDRALNHAITVNHGSNGTASANVNSVKGGDPVTITLNPRKGYTVDTLKDNDVPIDVSTLETVQGFKVYVIDTVVTAHRIDVTFKVDSALEHEITLNFEGSGTIIADDTTPQGGQDVTVTMTPGPGYKLSAVTDNNEEVSISSLTVDGNSLKYTMTSVIENHTIRATFVIDEDITHTISVDPYEHGEVVVSSRSPKGNDNVLITMTPETGYKLIYLKVDGVAVSTIKSGESQIYTISSVFKNYNVTVLFEIDTAVSHAITVTAGNNGIAAAGEPTTQGGGRAVVTITPDPGYMVASLTDNEVDVRSLMEVSGKSFVYSIDTVTRAHTIIVTFAIDTDAMHDVTATAGDNGQVETDKDTANGGSDVTISITPGPGYMIDMMTDNGNTVDVNKLPQASGVWTYVIKSITIDHDIIVTFKINSAAVYNINVYAGENGTASADNSRKNGGDNVTITIRPNKGYVISSLMDNAVSIPLTSLEPFGNAWTYTIEKVIAHHTVNVVFSIDYDMKHNIIIDPTVNGTVTASVPKPSGGSSSVITITPEEGYKLRSLTDNGVAINIDELPIIGGSSVYTITSIVDDHLIVVTFVIDEDITHSVIVTAGDHGTAKADEISPMGGENVLITIKPEKGYRVSSIKDNDTYPDISTLSVMADGSLLYFIPTISKTHNVHVSFTADETKTHSITVEAGDNGDASADETSPIGGTDVIVSITHDATHRIASILDNGTYVNLTTLVQMEDHWEYTVSYVTDSHLIIVEFEIDPLILYNMNVSSGDNGEAEADAVSPKGGSNVTVTITPASGYTVLSVTDNEEEVDIATLTRSNGDWLYVIPKIIADHSVYVSFEIDSAKIYDVTVETGENGSTIITNPHPKGGDFAMVSIAPAPGYCIASLTDNGNDVDLLELLPMPDGSFEYMMWQVISNHAIIVTFEIDDTIEYKITVNAGDNGEAEANETAPMGGDDVTVTITPDVAHRIASVSDNGKNIELTVLTDNGNGTWDYDLIDVIKDHTIIVVFEIDDLLSYEIEVTAGSNGAASADVTEPNGGDNVTVTITPAPGFKIASITDNGENVNLNVLTPVGNAFAYLIAFVIDDHDVNIIFEIDPMKTHIVTVTAGQNGEAEADVTEPNGGDDVTITITPESASYRILSVIDNSVNVPLGTLTDNGDGSWDYVISDIFEAHEVNVLFEIDPTKGYEITVNFGSNGTASADESDPMGGSDVIITITPNVNYRVLSVTDNGKNVDISKLVKDGAARKYTITEVISNHIVNVDFAIDDQQSHLVAVYPGDNGHAEADKTNPYGTENVEVTITPDDGYKVASLTDNSVNIPVETLTDNGDGTWTYTIMAIDDSHDIIVEFEVDPMQKHAIALTVGDNGNASSSLESAPGGSTVRITITPFAGYCIASVKDNNITVAAGEIADLGNGSFEYSIASVDRAHDIKVEFEIDSTKGYEITVNFGSNGTAAADITDPKGGDHVTITITPAKGYRIASLKDGSRDVAKSELTVVGYSLKYLIPDVIADHIIAVTFTIDEDAVYDIFIGETVNGNASADNESPNGGSNVFVTITPDPGYMIESLTDNGIDIDIDTLIPADDTFVYLISLIKENHNLEVVFKIDGDKNHNISASTDGRGDAVPGSPLVGGGDDVIITITSNAGYRVQGVTDNGEAINMSKVVADGENTWKYTIRSVTIAHNVYVTFMVDSSKEYVVNVFAGENGTASASKINVNGGDRVVVTMKPNNGYTLSSVTDNGDTVTATRSGNEWTYTMEEVIGNHSINVVFKIDDNIRHSITLYSDGKGEVDATDRNPFGNSTVSVFMTPESGYKVLSVTDNGTAVDMDDIQEADGSFVYVLSAIYGNHVINVIFVVDDELTHSVTGSSPGNGKVTVNRPAPKGGDNVVVTITPNAGYRLMSVTDNGTDIPIASLNTVGTSKMYLISVISFNHVIVAEFEVDSDIMYTVVVNAGENGTAVPDNEEPYGNSTVKVTMTPRAGFTVLSVMDNGIAVNKGDLTRSGDDWIYTMENIIGNHVIDVEFDVDTGVKHDIIFTIGDNGKAEANTTRPSGGDNVVITITPNKGYRVRLATDNNVEVNMNYVVVNNKVWTYTITNIHEDHTISVLFIIDGSVMYDVKAYTEGNGQATVDPKSPKGGENVTITITPDKGFRIVSVKDNSNDVMSSLVSSGNFSIYTIVEVKEDHRIDVVFDIDTGVSYDVIAEAGENGNVTVSIARPSGGGSSVVTITPNSGYIISAVTDNGVSVDLQTLVEDGSSWKYTISSISENHRVTVTFAIDENADHTVTVMAGPNGSAKADEEVVKGGSDVIITIDPYDGYRIASVKDNGETVNPAHSGNLWVYTISNITEDHLIEVEFKVNDGIAYEITVSYGDNGKATVDNMNPNGGEKATITITPDKGFTVDTVNDNGSAVTPTRSGDVWIYVIDNIIGDHLVEVEFAVDKDVKYNVYVTFGDHGTAVANESNPQGGEDVVVAITPNDGYKIASVTDNGVIVDPQSLARVSRTLYHNIPSIYSDHDVRVTFEVDSTTEYDIEVHIGDNGSATADPTRVNGGGNVTITITPDRGYRIGYLEDGDDEVDVSSLTRSGDSWMYVLESVVSNHVIEVTFEIDTDKAYTVTVNIEGKGSYTMDTPEPYGGDDIRLCFKPESGYKVETVTDNGSGVTPTHRPDCEEYIIGSIIEDHVITVVFAIDKDLMHDIKVTHGENGTASSGNNEVKGGSDVAITITPDAGYRILELTINGNVVDKKTLIDSGTSKLLTLEEVTESKDIHVTFELITYTVTLPEGSGFTVTAVDSESPVLPGGSFTFMLKIHSDYSNSDFKVMVNDVIITMEEVDPENDPGVYVYTIEDIQNDIAVMVSGVRSNATELPISTTTIVFGTIGAILAVSVAAMFITRR